MIAKLYRALLKILPRQRIPRLPRGMLSADFQNFGRDDQRVLARLGARDPRGIKVAMRRVGVQTIDELVDHLEHHQPQREFTRRLNAMICTIQGATNYDPHRAEILRDWKAEKQAQLPSNVEMKRRLNAVLKAFEEGC